MRVISSVPNGDYYFSDFVEADMVGQGLLRINLKLTIADGIMKMDFTGTAPQVRAALNLPSFGKTGHWMLITGVVNWLCTREPNIAYNAGLVRPMKVHIPKGTLINPEAGRRRWLALFDIAQGLRRHHRRPCPRPCPINCPRPIPARARS